MSHNIIISLITFSFLTYFANADPVFSGPIRMRGKIEEKSFQSPMFNINAIEEGYEIVNDQKNRKFRLKTEAKVIEDVVLSRSQNFAAVSLSLSNKFGQSKAVLATISATGDTLIYNYQDQRMTERFGWLIELGAVADDGKLILAKCAEYLPEENGMQVVNHRWVILAIDQGSLKVKDVLELEAAFTKWFEYTSNSQKK